MSERSCALCGSPVRPPFRAPQPEMAPDLDMRPGEPARSTLPDWIQTCDVCAAAAPDLATLPPAARAVVESEPYRALLGQGSEETLPFRRWAAICRATGAAPAEALLQAAWASDDAAAGTDAAAFRREVAAEWGDATDIETALRRLDVLRRAGEFGEAEEHGARVQRQNLDEAAASIVAFQLARIATRDIGRHLISSALPPPAHAPHVSHGKRPGGGFWSKVLRFRAKT